MKLLLKWAGYILLPILILFFIVLLNWESLSYFVLKNVAQYYAGREHIALEISAISGRPLTETTIENISILPEQGQPQAYKFSAQTITCSYDLWNLREGFGLFLEGLRCTVQTPELVQDFSVSMEPAEVESELKMFEIPAVLPHLAVHNGTVILSHADWDAEIRGINASLRSVDGVHELQLQVENLQFAQDRETRIDTGFTSLLSYTNEKITVDSFELGEQEISAAGFIDLAELDQGFTKYEVDFVFADSRLNIVGSMENKLLQAHVRTEKFDIGELQKRLGGTGWDIHGKIRGEADLVYDLEAEAGLNGSFVLGVDKGRLHGVDIETVFLEGVIDQENLIVSSAEAGTSGNYILVEDISVLIPVLQGEDVLAILGKSKAKFKADIADFTTLLQLLKVEENKIPEAVRPNSVAINGSLEKGKLYLEDARAVTSDSKLTIKEAIIPIPATKKAFELVPIDFAARIESGNLESLVGIFGEIPLTGQAAADVSITGSFKEPVASINLSGEYLGSKEIQLGSLSLQGDIRIAQEILGTIKSVEFEINEMAQENREGILGLLSPVIGTWRDDTFAMDATFELDGKGEISTSVSRTPGKEIVVEISTLNLDSDGWLGNFIDSRFYFHGANIEAALRGLFESTELQLSGTIREAGGTGVPFPLTGSFAMQYSSKGIEVKEFTWKSHERNQLTITGFLPYDPMAQEPFLDSDMTLKGHIDFPALEDIAVLLEPWGIGKGSVALSMDVSGTWNQPEGHIHFEVNEIEPPDTMRQYMDSAVNFSGDIAALGGTIVLQAAKLESTQYTAQASGSWKHGISVKELLQKSKAELKGEVKADAKVKLKDLNFLRRKLPWLRRLEGDMQGELHLAGPVTKPALKGSFSLKDGEASHTFNFPMLSAVNLVGEFDEHSISIENMRAEVGGSPVNLSGRINKDKETVVVNLHVDGKNVLLFRNNDMRMRGDVQLDVSGPLDRLAIKGTTGLTGGYYTRNIDFLGMLGSSSAPVSEGAGFLFSFPDPPLNDAVIDIRITTIEPFRIRNNLIRGVLRPELSLKGTGELPFLLGNVYIDSSRVILPSGRLQVQSGLLRFLEEEPDRPQLDLLAQSKVLGYDINVVTRGPIDDPVITLSSSPALPNDELMLLLLTGQPPKEDAAGGAKGSGTTNVMVYLGRDFLNKWLEDESGASDETILDRFELDFGRNITKSGEQTVESTFRLSEYTTGTGKIYYLTGEKDKYDAYNYGVRLVFSFE